MENKWRAARYGLDGKLIDFGRRVEVPMRDLVEEYLAFVDDVVDELGSREEVNGIRKIVEMGSGADRQLRVFKETGDLTKVVDYIIEETELRFGTRMQISAMTDLRGIPFDPEYAPGARNAVDVCLRVQPHEKVTLITDHACLEIAASLAAELDRWARRIATFVLEEIAPRPLTDMPQAVLDDLESSQVSIFAVVAQQNELRTRMQMTEVVNRRGIRHAHMVNIERRIMLEGMRADFLKVDELS